MKLTQDLMRERFNARDGSYDGRFLAGVLSTGIYCLPSCRARRPRPENLRFFASPAAAEAAGLRPCRRCRPDFFYARHDPERDMLLEITARLREEPGMFPSVQSLAKALAMSETRLNEVFHAYYHRTAGSYLAEARVAKACRLLRSTGGGMTDIAAASGYESLSSFNENFRRMRGLNPGVYRALAGARAFTLILPGGASLSALRFQARDAKSLCERFQKSTLFKAFPLDGQPVKLEMTAAGDRVVCRVETPQGGAIDMHEVHAIALRLLGFTPDPAPFERMACKHPLLQPLVARRPGLRIPQTATVFEGVAWAVIGQQINLSFAFELRRRLVRLAGMRMADDFYAHPTPEAVAALDYEDLTRLQFSRRKAEYLIDLARLVAKGEAPLAAWSLLPAGDLLDKLQKLKGIGAWSANYLGMRAFAFADCVPLGDTGLAAGLQGLMRLSEKPTAEEAGGLLAQFRPYRSFVTFHLWQAQGGV